MAGRLVEIFEFGGVDSRSNPLNFPPNRSMRCKNWIRTQAGELQLRFGYTQPTMSAVDTTSAIHSAMFYEKHNGTKFILFSQGTALKQMAVGSTGTVTAVNTLASSSPWYGVFVNNNLFMVTPSGFKYWDSSVLRNVGIRAPSSAEASSVSATFSTASGTFSATQLGGYYIYMAYYNPTTGHVGNGSTVSATPLTCSGSTNQLLLTGLPDLSMVDVEWVKIFGRSNDNGQVGYIFQDANGNWVSAGNTATSLTITSPSVDFNSEIPAINSVPSTMTALAFCQGRMYGILSSDPHYFAYSAADFDDVASSFVGRPEQAWPAAYRTPFPTGERCIAIHEQNNEIWVWSRNHLVRFQDYGGYTTQGGPVIIALATHVGGIAGQRAFTKTPYGPFWVSADKELMTFGDGGPVPVSGEYHTLLSQIDDANLGSIEIIYFRDPRLEIDRLYILGRDASNNPILIVHDFLLRSQQSPTGQGSDYLYVGAAPYTLVRNSQSVVSVRDSNDRPRLWAGSTAGRFMQLEDGDHDNGSTYSADYITLINMGVGVPQVGNIEFQGDTASQWFARSDDLLMDENDLNALDQLSQDVVDEDQARYEVNIESPGQYFALRIKLDSHHADGSLSLSSLNHFPVETYGRILVVRPDVGRPRPEGRRKA